MTKLGKFGAKTAAIFSLFLMVFATGLAFFGSGVQASTATNEAMLLQRVYDWNVGWNYVPDCNSETFWDVDDGRCEFGDPDGDSYGLMNREQLMQKVIEVDAGWDWVPSCGDGARWDKDEKRCEGGSG